MLRSPEDEAECETSALESRFTIGPNEDLDGDVTGVCGYRLRRHTVSDQPSRKNLNLAPEALRCSDRTSYISPM